MWMQGKGGKPHSTRDYALLLPSKSHQFLAGLHQDQPVRLVAVGILMVVVEGEP